MSDQQPRPTGYQPTTTHAEWGSGHPRLLVSHAGDHEVFHLTFDLVHIGSDEGNHLHITGIEPLHATIVHDERDEYVLTMHGPGEMNASSTAGTKGERTEVLRTGARFTAGEWTFVFTRDEFADHGRPYGGREGGEGATQRRQPDRPEYQPPVQGA